jgi:hypothetical protein
MDLWAFWVLAIFWLGYCTFFVTVFPINEALLASGQPLTAKTFWPALLLTTVMSLFWWLFVIIYGRRYARS